MIRVTGGSASQKKYVPSVVNFCIKKLMPRMKNIHVTVRLKDLKGEAYGYCLSLCDDGERGDRPRSFEIELEKNVSLRRVLETLCHEMVHVKQYARGELYESCVQGKHRWQGTWLNKDPDYWDQPWEIEAHGRECGLFVRWAESEGLGNKKWTHDS
jgi:hypothetical protein